MSRTDRLLGEPLTEREREILDLIAQGWSNQEIADIIMISERTVRTHAVGILAKLGARNRTDAARIAREMGLLDGEPRQVAARRRRYAHRDGSHEPPTEPGHFWTESGGGTDHNLIQLAASPWGEWRMRRLGGDWEPYMPEELAASGMRFWGPVATPWNARE
jgi:DNA-binding CsgD family transcriptional regulator